MVVFGEIGGSQEERLAALIEGARVTKPVIAYIGGAAATEGTRFSHAGAIIAGGKGGAEDKIEALKSAGIQVADSPASLGSTMLSAMGG